MSLFKYFTALLIFGSTTMSGVSQCAMCRAVVESEVASEGAAVSEGINTGILYLMGFPYLLMFAVLIYLFRNQLKGLMTKA